MDLLNEQRANLKSLLNLLNETLEKNTSERASDLHMISLFNLNKLMLGDPKKNNSERDKRTEKLKRFCWIVLQNHSLSTIILLEIIRSQIQMN